MRSLQALHLGLQTRLRQTCLCQVSRVLAEARQHLNKELRVTQLALRTADFVRCLQNRPLCSQPSGAMATHFGSKAAASCSCTSRAWHELQLVS